MNELATTAPAYTSSWSVAKPRFNWLLIGLWLSLFLIRGFLYLALIPPWQAPDEPTSVELLLTMQARGRLVSIPDMDLDVQRIITSSMVRGDYWKYGYGRNPGGAAPIFEQIWPGRTQLNRPPLYQLLLLPGAYATASWPIEARLYVFHALSLLMVAGTALSVLSVGRTFAGELPALPWVVAALAMFHPQLTLIGVSVNSDNFAGLVGSLVFLVLLKLFRDGLSWRRVVLLAGLIAMGIWTKRTTFFLLPTVIIALLVLLGAQWRRLQAYHRRRIGLVGGAVGIAFGGLLFTPLAPTIVRTVSFNFFDYQLAGRFGQFVAQLQNPQMPFGTWFATAVMFLNRTFWADVGWHRGVLPPIFNALLLGFVASSWLAALALTDRLRRRWQPWQRNFLLICWIGLGLNLVQTFIHFFTYAEIGLPHGRYLFPSFVPIMLLIALGVCGWWPHRWTKWGSTVVLLFAMSFDLYAIFGLILPAFYG